MLRNDHHDVDMCQAGGENCKRYLESYYKADGRWRTTNEELQSHTRTKNGLIQVIITRQTVNLLLPIDLGHPS